MSMFNFDGQIVAGVLQTQQAGEVFRGILDQRRQMKAEELQQQQEFTDQQRYMLVVAKYNDLADRYNAMLADNTKVDEAYAAAVTEKDERIAQLIAENARLAAEKEDSRKSAYEGWTKMTYALEEIERLKIKAGELAPDESKPDLDL